MKDYSAWTRIKTNIHNRGIIHGYREGSIYWASIGKNIGWEEDGKGGLFVRPVLVIKGISRNLFIGIPLTSKTKTGASFYSLGVLKNGIRNTAILAQIRAFDAARIISQSRVIDRISKNELNHIKQLIYKLLQS